MLTLAFFLLLDGVSMFERMTSRLAETYRVRIRRVGEKIARIVRSYVTVNLFLAVLAGVFTWLSLELLGVDLAVPLGVLVAMLDLVPLIGFTVGGLLVAVVAALHDFPTALIIWARAVPGLPAAPGPGDPADLLQERGPHPARRRGARRARRGPARGHPRRPARDPDRGRARRDLRRALAPQARRRSGRRRAEPEPEGEGSGSGAGVAAGGPEAAPASG